MKTKSTKRSLLVSALVLLLCVSMLIGSTFAWFTDSVASTNNIIKSGSLDIELEYSMDGATWEPVGEDTPLFNEESLWEPGHTEYVLLRVKNVGTLAVKYVLKTEIIEERQGINVYGDIFNLSDYLKYGVVTEDDVADVTTDRADAVAKAVTALTSSIDVSDALEVEGLGYQLSDGTVSADAGLLPQQSAVVGLIITMPTTVGNEANYRAPATYAADSNVDISDYAPYIKFGVNLYATQLMYENDSFGNDYDRDAFVEGGSASGVVVEENEWITLDVRGNVEGNANGIVAEVLVHRDSVVDKAAPVTVTIVPTDLNEDVTVEADQLAKTYDISVTNVKEDNAREISIDLQVGKGLSGVKVYHKDKLLTDASYNRDTGIARFKTLSFSPFTVVYDGEAEDVVTPEYIPEDMPKADVIEAPEHVGVDLPWQRFGGFYPTEGLDSQLEAAYVFKCQETGAEAALNKYANWKCDFYVKLDRDLGPNQIFLGGNYFDFSWVGFHNGDVTLNANEELALLGSVTNDGWTYQEIAANVGTFTCGVGDVDDALSGATFTVMLRLTNPENKDEFYNVATIEHTFQ